MRIHRLSIAVSSAFALVVVLAFGGSSTAAITAVNTGTTSEDETTEETTAQGQETPENPTESQLLEQTVNDALVATLGELEAAKLIGPLSPYADIVADTELVDASTINIAYWPYSPLSSGFLADLAAVSDKLSMSVVAVSAQYHPAATNSFARHLSTSPDTVLQELDAETVDSVIIDTKTGRITVMVSGSTGDTDNAVLGGLTVTVDRSGSADPQSRLNDNAPWSGGTQLRGNRVLGDGPSCTAGFTWVKWQTSAKLGSTAEHCLRITGNSVWYNWGTHYGNRYYYSVAVDTALLMSSPISQFRPTVFIGTQTTNVLRWVHTSVASEPVGGTVALSGGRSGLHSGTILSRTVYDGGSGPYRTTTVSQCLAGDSGSPWLTTTSSGRAVAHGQHGGVLTMSSGAKYCYYMPVNKISAALSASIYTYSG